MSDELLDCELAALLSVEPSPGFVARVRMHVSSQTSPRMSWLGVRWIAIVAAAVVAVGTLVGIWTLQSRRVDREESHVTTPVTVTTPTGQRQDARVNPSAAQLSAPSALEVLVSPMESQVVQRLLIAAHGAAVVPAARSSKADAPLLPSVPIAIAPITLEPLAAAADLESGVNQ